MEPRDALRLGVGLAGRGAMLKVGAIAAALVLVAMILLGAMGAITAQQATASDCGGRGTPQADAGGSSDGGSSGAQSRQDGHLRKKQVANAKIIDGVAKKAGLSGRATLIALAVGLQESQLLNLDGGHADSVGIFQQRPSQGWGSKSQLMTPKFAAHRFFFGAPGGSPAGLTDVKNWEERPLKEAAQAVQVSKYPELYAGQEKPAQEIADEAGIDLDRKGTSSPTPDDTGSSKDTGGDTSGDTSGGAWGGKCPSELEPEDGGDGGGGGKSGKAFHDGDAPWPASVKNPRSTAEAIRWARNQAKNGGKKWYRLCLAFVGQSYGRMSTSSYYAIDQYRNMPESMKHDKDRHPPKGAMMFWDTGNRAGHVALYLGDGKIASNDIRRPGYIDIVPATEIEKKWGATYVGWAPPKLA